MEGAGSKVNKEMAAAQKVAGFEYNDFEASISKFDSAFQVLFPSCAPPLYVKMCSNEGPQRSFMAGTDGGRAHVLTC